MWDFEIVRAHAPAILFLPAETKEANEIKNTEHVEYIACSTIGFLSKEQLENLR
jgi:hypothetical protein